LLAVNGIARGSIRFQGLELLDLSERETDRLRGSQISMIFQDPMTSLNPYMKISDQLCESLMVHQGLDHRSAQTAALSMLDRVRIPDAKHRFSMYPHEFSGGMRQRVMIAMALLNRPALLLADEPTTALDVTVQSQILDLLKELARDFGTAIIIVTHDLGVVARLADRVIVLYGGRVMEEAETLALFSAPQHPYTKGLIATTPRWDDDDGKELRIIPGQPRHLADATAPGCPFFPRCSNPKDHCAHMTPEIQEKASRRLACHGVQL
jgi:oligopeptide transport system ATP-binding protein